MPNEEAVPNEEPEPDEEAEMTAATRQTARPAQRREHAPSSEADRGCAVCGERLSAYNPGPNCYAHTVGLPWKGPNNRP